ncbi:MAG: ABC transporter permease [Chloroherpetonaceae bacterium]|nr:ABC transporter permease [Chloroherpetonaceae bacterium]
MALPYWVRESFSGFQRAKLSTTVTILTVGISLIILGFFTALSLNATRILDEIKEQVEVEYFLSESLTKEEMETLLIAAKSQPWARKAEIISKERAAEIFKKEFGEDIVSILGVNPLPVSLRLSLWPAYASLDSLELTVKRFQAIAKSRFPERNPILETRYNKEFLLGLDKNARLLTSISIGLGFIISLASIALVSNTIRLAIYAKRDIIKTMKLVGATSFFIRVPFILEGLMQGLLGGVISVVALRLFQQAIQALLPVVYEAIRIENPNFYFVLILIGAGFGLIGSMFSIRKFIAE